MERIDVLQTAGAWFPGQVGVVESDSVTGQCRGVGVTLSFPNHGCGSTPDPWTEIVVRTQLHGVSLELREQTDTEEHLEAMALVRDLKTNDPAFDSAYVVEGAPRDIVVAWLDQDVRERLLAVGAPGVKVSGSTIQCKRRGWIHDTAVLRSMVDATALLAANLPASVQRANQGAAAAYRDGAAQPGVAAARAGDLAELEETKRLRLDHSVRQAAKVGTALLLSLVGSILGWILISVVIAVVCYLIWGSD
jgi:hypothetical protein